VDPVSDPLLVRKSGIAGNLTQIPASVARNSDHWTTEAVVISTTRPRKCKNLRHVSGIGSVGPLHSSFGE
jgi:hypothetical protein